MIITLMLIAQTTCYSPSDCVAPQYCDRGICVSPQPLPTPAATPAAKTQQSSSTVRSASSASVQSIPLGVKEDTDDSDYENIDYENIDPDDEDWNFKGNVVVDFFAETGIWIANSLAAATDATIGFIVDSWCGIFGC